MNNLLPYETWRPIKGFSDYEVSNYGRVLSRKSKNTRILKSSSCRGYRVLILRKDGKSYGCKIHRLVAEAFIPNPYNLPCVNHKDGVKSNNCVSNLEWCTVAYNNSYGDKPEKGAKTRTTPVYQYSISGELIKCWDSVKSAAKYYGCTRENIYLACKETTNTAIGFKWSYYKY